MRIVNTELFRPANAIAIVLIVFIAGWVTHNLFGRHVIDQRKRARAE